MSRSWLVVVAALGAATAVAALLPAAQPWARARDGTVWASLPRVARGLRLRPAPRPPVLELLSALSAELAAGQPTGPALDASAAGLTPNPCPEALAAVRMGGNVAEALRRDATASGAQALRALAACWEVAEHSGAGLATAVHRLADGLRASDQADAQLSGEIAAVRTSARLLAGLPLLGLAIGHWIGADPVAFLTGSWAGRGVLVAGLTLQVAGMVWLHRLVATTRAGL